MNAPVIDASAIQGSRRLARLEEAGGSARIAMMGFAAIVAGIHLWAAAAGGLSAPLPLRIALPEVNGWRRVDYNPSIWWEPRAQGADHRLLGRYRNAEGQVVDVFVALYASQDEGKEAGGFGQGALVPASPWSWQSPVAAPDGGKGERLLGNGEVVRVAMTWYRLGGGLSGSNARLKLAVMADRLMFRRRPTMMLILSAEDTASVPAVKSIARFRSSTGPLGAWMDGIGRVR
ncbi:exosortase C-terminal domain/associated protein EpsI [Novosphingobium panipatense]